MYALVNAVNEKCLKIKMSSSEFLDGMSLQKDFKIQN